MAKEKGLRPVVAGRVNRNHVPKAATHRSRFARYRSPAAHLVYDFNLTCCGFGTQQTRMNAQGLFTTLIVQNNTGLIEKAGRSVNTCEVATTVNHCTSAIVFDAGFQRIRASLPAIHTDDS